MSAKKMIVSDKIKGREFQKVLKKMGIQEKFMNMERVADQKRSLKMMLNAEKGKNAKIKALNSAELAHVRMVYQAMVVSHQNAMGRIVAATNAAGAGITAGLTLPAFLAQGALAGLGRVITKMAPAIAALGTIMSAVFGAAMFFFIAKFIYDMWTTTKKQRMETRKSKEEWKAIAVTMEQIADLQKDKIGKAAEEFLKTQKEINKELIKRYNIMQGLIPREKFDEAIQKGDIEGLQQFFASNLGGVGVQEGGPEAIQKAMLEFKRDLQAKIFVPYGDQNEYNKKTIDRGAMMWFKRFEKALESGTDGIIKWVLANETFMEQMIKYPQLGMNFVNIMEAIKDGTGSAGEEIKNFSDALSTLEDQMKRYTSNKYKPSIKDNWMTGARSMTDAIDKWVLEEERIQGLDLKSDAGRALAMQDFHKKFGDPTLDIKGSGVAKSIGYKKGMGPREIQRRLRGMENLLELDKGLNQVLAQRVHHNKTLATLAGRLGDSHGRQLARSYQLTGLEAQRVALLAELAATTGLLKSTEEGVSEQAAQDLQNQLIKLETLTLQTHELEKQSNYMLRITEDMVKAFDTAGQKNLADIILGKEGSGKDAILNTIKSTLEAGANVLAEQLMSPITGAVKGLFGIKDPEEERERVMVEHVQNMETVLRAHVEAMGMSMEGVGELLGGEGKGILGLLMKMMSKGGGGGGSDFFSTILSAFMGGAKGGLVRKYAYGTGSGGASFVPGTGSRDSVPALLTPGEIVIPKGKRVGGNYNTTINVNMEGGGDVTTDDDTGAALGMAIQMAVTEEIANQQRPGGLLSPFGG